MEQANQTIMELLGQVSMRPDTSEILLSLAGALALSLLMWFAYRKTNTEASYHPHFAVTLISIALLSTVLMDLIQSNLALSLGMLGALSIIRFRTTIHDPRDIGFIFWAMAIGLAASTGSYLIGLIGSIAVGFCMIFAGRNRDSARDMLLVVRGSRTDPEHIGSIIEASCCRSRVKAQNMMSDSFELVYEVHIPMQNSNAMIGRLFDLKGIDTVNLLADAKNA